MTPRNRNYETSTGDLRPEDGEWIANVETGEIVCERCLVGVERQIDHLSNVWIKLSAGGKQQIRVVEPVHPDGWEANWPIPLRCHRCDRATLPMPPGHYFERVDHSRVQITDEALDAAITSY